MTVVEEINRICDWLNENICPSISLKVPDDFQNDEGMTVQEMHPHAFPLFIPGEDKLPPNIPAPIPSICVQLMKGTDDLTESKRELEVRLCMNSWSPGDYGAETAQLIEDDKALGGYRYRVDPNSKTFNRNVNGWVESYNFLDKILTAVEETEFINGLRLKKEDPIEFGPFTESGELVDYYPYWHNYISLKFEAGRTISHNKSYADLLK